MSKIAERIESVQRRINAATKVSGRKNEPVTLLAVSKTRPATDIIRAYWSGLRHFGENYLQEALAKQQTLAHYQITWHFIGPTQSNKTRYIASKFAWVHTIDRFKIAKRLSEQRPPHLPPLNVCIQINVDQESTKSGVSIDESLDLATAISDLPRLRLRGLMTIPQSESVLDKQRLPFRKLRELCDNLKSVHLDTLSMGMSGDLEAAIAEHATIVRIGTAIFGGR